MYDQVDVPLRWADSHDYAVYVQDAWRPFPRLTVSAGVRVDFIGRKDSAFNVETQNSTEIGPRFGVNYLLTRDGRRAVRASWTRVADVLAQTTQSAGSNVSGFRDLYDTDLDGTFETTFITPGVSAQSTDRVLDDARHQPHTNEWIVGYRQQLPRSGERRRQRGAARVPGAHGSRGDQRHLRGQRLQGLPERSVQRHLQDHQQRLELAGLHVPRAPGHEADRALSGHRQLYASVAPSGWHVAAERSGVVHSAGRVSQQQGDWIGHEHVRVTEQPVEQPGRQRAASAGRRRHGPARRDLSRSVGLRPCRRITRFSQASGPVRSSRAWLRPIRGSGPRPCTLSNGRDGVEPAGDDHPLCLPDARRGAVHAAHRSTS